MSSGGHWRWSADTTWHYHASMTWAMKLAAQQQSEFGAYSYTRTCLYFAVAALESCLNQSWRAYLEKAGKEEDEVFKALRRTKFKEKLKWPETIYRQHIPVGEDLSIAIEVRNELTHAKKRDHSIYRDLDAIDLTAVVNGLSLYVVSMKQLSRMPFPYWLLGWNYVIVVGKDIQVLELNNMNAFYYSARSMGIVTGYNLQSDWDQRNMVSPACFDKLKTILEEKKYDIEPPVDGFPFRNRLTRRWWDDEFVRASWGAH